MNNRNIIILFLFYFIVNVYGTLIEDEDLDLPSNDKFNQVAMTATSQIAVKTIPTQYASSTPSLKVIPSKTIPTTETTVSLIPTSVIIPYEDVLSIRFLKAETMLPSDIDGVYATCVKNYLDENDEQKKNLDMPYICYDNECYHEYNTISGSGYYFSYLDCKMYTSKSSDPTPTTSVLSLTGKICKPTYSTDYYTTVSTVIVNKIPHGTDSNAYTGITTRIESVRSNILTNQYECYKTRKDGTFIETFTPTMTSRTNSILTIPTDKPYVRGIITVPASIKNFAITCSTSSTVTYVKSISNSYSSKKILRRDVVNSSIKSTKVIPTTLSASKSSNTYPTKGATNLPTKNPTSSNSSINTRTSSKSSVKTRTSLGFYCEDESFCLQKCTHIGNTMRNYYSTIVVGCDIYTPVEKPTQLRENIVTTSICRPITTIERRGRNAELYGKTIITSGNLVTTIYTEFVTYNNVLWERCNTLKPTSTISSSSSVTVTPSTKCIPEVITVTVKDKITVTEKETITVTVKEDTPSPQENCAPKWAQCGGIDYKGPTCCQSGSSCHEVNQYYSQCI